MTLPVILHISDIHRTKDEPVTNDQIILPLLGEFDRYAQESLPIPNVVVISGDLTQSSQPEEYDEAGELIQKLLGRLSLGLDRLGRSSRQS
jgi:3',5'-cyclic AMP phosphodiesterase CpdA